MKREFVFGTILSAALAAGLDAQSGGQSPTPSPASSATTPQESRPSESRDTVTLTGCLQTGDMATAGTSGSTTPTPSASTPAPASASAAQFILTDATMSMSGGAASRPSPAGTSGGATAGAAGSTQTSYRLVGGDKSELQKHTNHQVEVKGTLESNASSSSRPSAGAPGGATPPAQSADSSLKTLRVTSVREIGATCAGK